MATLINKYAETVMIRSINRLINKYGHNVELRQTREAQPVAITPSKATFGRFKIAFGNNNMIINNNYRVRLRADSFPYSIEPTDVVLINGVTLSVLKANKISPDGATAIVWELECTGDTIPYDSVSAATPSVISPTNNTAFYASVQESGGLYSASFTASAYQVLSGDTTYLSSDWQISSDELFSTIVDDVYAYTGGNTWVSGVILGSPINYWVRVRHNGTGGITTSWSTPSKFSLAELDPIPVPTVEINTPALLTPSGWLVEDETYFRNYDLYTSGFEYKAAPFMSEFSSSAGKTFSHIHWIVRNDAGAVWEGDSSGGYDVDIARVLDYNQMIMPYKTESNPWYIKGKYVATDSTESLYSDEVMYSMD